MIEEERRRILEALIFASDVPFTYSRAREIMGDISAEEFVSDIDALELSYHETGRAVEFLRAAGGVQMATKPEFAVWVRRLLADRLENRLSRPALEALAIVAYRQPIIRSEIERVRGVDCGGVLGTLMERNLITVGGRATTPGRPLLYITTQDFLRYFGLNEIEDLPKTRELQGLMERDPQQVIMPFNGMSESQGTDDDPGETPDLSSD
ncbi:SMC-Scp complex subunit ScpB [bacterium]|nr:SMC-Scp complex subunit ScpB [bacterium]MBU1652262.1 SMC-Scp complex subunit ScpB [bacterium]MBU1882201.1 SMC-Scp complex subunit ScpB [bacterium]